MTKTEILELNIQDQNELIGDLDLACKEMEDLLRDAETLIFCFPAFMSERRFFSELRTARDKWLDQYKKWNDALEKQ